MALKIKTQTFLNKFDIGNLNSFILNYQKTNYLISVHHNLPIDSVYDWNNQKLKIKVNSCWSEVLIMETDNIDLSNITINYKVQNKLPKKGQNITIKTDKERFITPIIDYVLFPFDNITGNYKIPYIRSRLIGKIENISGLSGSPAFIDDKLVGVFAKFDEGESVAYIVPIYIVIKNLMKNIYKYLFILYLFKVIIIF
jgi:hypothetical protein